MSVWLWEVKDDEGWRTIKPSEGKKLLQDTLERSRYGRFLTIEQRIKEMKDTQRPIPIYSPEGSKEPFWMIQITQKTVKIKRSKC